MEKQSSITITKKQLAVVVIIILILITGGIVVGLNWNNWFSDSQTAQSSGDTAPSLELDPNAQTWQGSQLENKDGQKEGIQIPGYPSISLPADTKDVSVALLNPEGNPCYFTFELVLSDTNEVLYTSKLVEPGQAIYNISLSRPLEAGEYDAVIRISTTSLEDGSAMNGANVETKLVVQ